MGVIQGLYRDCHERFDRVGNVGGKQLGRRNFLNDIWVLDLGHEGCCGTVSLNSKT